MIPKRASRLPNAPRDYRNGTHRGIDFFANWGTDIRAVADGLVVRADHNYEEYPADFRVEMLKSSGKVGHTPSDIFNSVLLGKAIILDHGFDLVPGFRAITIYAPYKKNKLRLSVQFGILIIKLGVPAILVGLIILLGVGEIIFWAAMVLIIFWMAISFALCYKVIMANNSAQIR